MSKTILIIIIVLLVALGLYFFLRPSHTNSQKTGNQNSSISNIHNSIRSFVGH